MWPLIDLSGAWTRLLCVVRAVEVFGDFIRAFMEVPVRLDVKHSSSLDWHNCVIEEGVHCWLVNPVWKAQGSGTLCPFCSIWGMRMLYA